MAKTIHHEGTTWEVTSGQSGHGTGSGKEYPPADKRKVVFRSVGDPRREIVGWVSAPTLEAASEGELREALKEAES